MSNGSLVKENLINLISKIGEKITIRRSNFFDNLNGLNFFYVHSAIEKNIGKIISVVKAAELLKVKMRKSELKLLCILLHLTLYQ